MTGSWKNIDIEKLHGYKPKTTTNSPTPFLLNEDDYTIYGEKVKLETWLRKYEFDQIISALKLQRLVEERLMGLDTEDLMTQRFHNEEVVELLQELLEESRKQA